MSGHAQPVFIRRGDGRAEVDEILHQLEERSLPGEDLGFAKYLYVTKADQTVVIVTSRGTPLAQALRARPGWSEPVEG
ncbi:hypothetical protein BH20GEM3_BH20GEM3_08880 [soil metagenome]|jgi:hypothetical protein|nr:hypothetical protein [Gemmatimonadota bacterium]